MHVKIIEVAIGVKRSKKLESLCYEKEEVEWEIERIKENEKNKNIVFENAKKRHNENEMKCAIPLNERYMEIEKTYTRRKRRKRTINQNR